MASKYRKYYRSRLEFRTPSGTNTSGSVQARKDVEKELERPLRTGTKVSKKGGNWVFSEPKLLPTPKTEKPAASQPAEPPIAEPPAMPAEPPIARPSAENPTP